MGPRYVCCVAVPDTALPPAGCPDVAPGGCVWDIRGAPEEPAGVLSYSSPVSSLSSDLTTLACSLVMLGCRGADWAVGTCLFVVAVGTRTGLLVVSHVNC